jgi:hypothetical protein
MGRDEAASLLGVPVDADPDVVRHAWRLWAKVAHPDVGGEPAHFERLDEARRILLQPRPVPFGSQPEPRTPWRTVLRRPARPVGLLLAAVGIVLLADLPAVTAVPFGIAASAAAIASAAWAVWATREVLGERADHGHRIAALALLWLPVAVAQVLVSVVVGVSLVPVLPLFAVPLVVAVAAVNPGAGLWRPVGDPGASFSR